MSVTDSLAALRDAAKDVRLDLEVPGALEARGVRDDLVAQVDDYLLPRLAEMDAPVLMVVGGSTGAGKSTLVNSLVGSIVSPAGVLRPTTRAPVLVCHPDDLERFETRRILPGLPRATGGTPSPGTLQLVPTPSLPPGLALLDSPDIDSVLAENRVLANQLLAAADAWLFVTTAARYADAVPWEFLQAARDRGTALSVVLNRVPADAGGEVSTHLGEMLREQGLGGAELLLVPETTLEDDLLPAAALAPVRRWLDGLAADAQARADLVRRTLRGALASIPAQDRDDRARRRRPARDRRRADCRDRRRLRRRSARDRGGAPQRVAAPRRGPRPLARGRGNRRRDARARVTSRLGSRQAEEPRHGPPLRAGGARGGGREPCRGSDPRGSGAGRRARRPRLARPLARQGAAGRHSSARPRVRASSASRLGRRCAPGRGSSSTSSERRAPRSGQRRGSRRSA